MPRKFDFEINSSSQGTIPLNVVDFTAHEYMSAPFTVNLQLVSLEDQSEIDFDEVIEQPALLTIMTTEKFSDSAIRYFHGIIREFVKLGYVNYRYIYRAVMVPEIWKLSLITNSRIFQKSEILKSSPGPNDKPIVNTILGEAKIDYEIIAKATYEPRDYCAQYRETNLNFISRLLEEEGIFYFFKHFNEKNIIKDKLVIGDSGVNYKSTGRYIPFSRTGQNSAMSSGRDFVYDFTLSRSIYSGKVTLRDFDFRNPASPGAPLELSSDTKNLTDREGIDFSKLETYEYPGGYTTYSPKTKSDSREINKRLPDVRLQEEAVRREIAYGKSVCHDIIPGHIFTLSNAPFILNRTDNDNNGTQDGPFSQEYVPIEIIHRGTQPNKIMGDSHNTSATYYNEFYAVPSSVTFRPQRKTPRNVIRGPQTAVVVDANGDVTPSSKGPQAAENVYTDNYGRVKVRFHWERAHQDSKGDNKWYNTAWVRVSQAWAGQGWGSMHIPHVGQEVIVDFLDSDPDRPIITGRVYNGDNQPYHNTTEDTMRPNINPHISGFRDEFGNELIFDATPSNPNIRLGNPKHDYLVIDNKGTDRVTAGDKFSNIFGNIVQTGAGTRVDALAGFGFDLKAGGTLAAMIGQAWEVFIGGKHSFEWSYVIEHSISKKFSSTSSDILSLSKDDQLHAAGDGFCIAGGTKKPEVGTAAARTDINNSIMNAYKDALVLSYGKKVSPVEDKKITRALGISLGLTAVTLVIALGAVSSNVLPDIFDLPDWGKTSARFGATVISGIAIGLMNLLIMGWQKEYLTSATTAEPVFHDKVEALIALNKRGITFGVKPDAPVQPVQPVQPGEPDKWHKKIADTIDPAKIMRSKMLMKEDGSISINSNPTGAGAKKEIALEVGANGGEDSKITMAAGNLKMASGTSSITITKNDAILIDTHDGNKNITLNAGGGAVEIKGATANVVGSKFTSDSVAILKGLKVVK